MSASKNVSSFQKLNSINLFLSLCDLELFFGGSGGGSLFAVHNECEYYDQASDQWLPVAPMTTRRSRCGVATVHGMLYAIGGYEHF